MQRRITRVAAVECVYSCDITENYDKESIVELFKEKNGTNVEFEGEGGQIVTEKYNEKLFNIIVGGTLDNLAIIDEKIIQCIAENWEFIRVERVLRAILRCAVFEMLIQKVPYKVVINEYLEVTKLFYAGKKEVSFVNGILNKIYVNSKN